MSRLCINNIGPVKHAEINLNRINVFIGPQSSGKSTIAKIISFFTWMEKVNESTERIISKGVIDSMKSYHRMTDYFTAESSLLYVGENIAYAYQWKEPLDFLNDNFKHYNVEHLNSQGHTFFALEKTTNPKVLYIPAERNFVSVIPNLNKYSENDDSLQSFINDWFEAKRHFSVANSIDICNLGIKYYFNEKAGDDYLAINENKNLLLRDASSGLQSLTPLTVLVNWMSNGIFSTSKPFSPDESQKVKELLNNISGGTKTEQEQQLIDRLKGFISGKVYSHSQFIIEEPEQNLFPKTQKDLLYYLLQSINHGRNHKMVLTTHSPYILYALNNSMLAYLTKDNIMNEVKNDISCLQYAVDPKQVSVWQIEDGYIKGIDGQIDTTIQDKAGLIRKNYFDNIMGDIMSDFNAMINFYEH